MGSALLTQAVARYNETVHFFLDMGMDVNESLARPRINIRLSERRCRGSG